MEVRLTVPVADNLLARLAMAVEVYPLSRPRVNFYTKSMYQPLKNQEDLRNNIEKFGYIKTIDEPCAITVIVNWDKLNSRLKWPTAKKRGDADNLLKAVKDGLVDRGIIKDDALAVDSRICKAWGDLDFCYVEIYSIADEPEYLFID